MNTDTDPPHSSRQESFQSFGRQIAGDEVDAGGGSQQNRRKKRSTLSRTGDLTALGSRSYLKPKSGKKPDPSAPKITRPCTECGKQFWSWKALFGHMRCHPERQWRGINPPPNFRRPELSPETPVHGLGTKMTEEDHEVASCLVMLASGSGAIDARIQCVTFDRGLPESDNTIGEASMEGDLDGAGPSGSNCRFECSSCKKVFGSHQALGGHRATHKNVKGCFAIARNDGEEEERSVVQGADNCGDGELKETGEDEMDMDLGHKCSICLKVFSSGQALGGHKRCHWERGDEPSPSMELNPSTSRDGCYSLDLNLPAPTDGNEDSSASSSSSDLGLSLRLGI